MLINFILINLPILIFSYFLFHSKYDKFGVYGIDVFRWMYYALELKSNHYKWPSKMAGYLDDKPLNYPPLYIYTLSILPKNLILKKPHYIQQLLFVLEYVALFWFLNSYYDLTLIYNFIVGIAFTMYSYKKYSYISSRPLGYFLVSLYIISLSYIDLVSPILILIICAFIYIILLFSHRFSIQFILVIQILISLSINNHLLNSITIALIVCHLIVFITSKQYRKIFLNHYSILTYYFEGINIGSDWEFKTPKLYYKAIFINILYSLPFIVHIFYLYLFDITFSINTYIIIIGLIYSTIMNISIFRFWGEPNRILDYLIIPLMIDIFQGDSNYIFFSSSLLIIQFMVGFIYRKKNNTYYHLNAAKNNLLSDKLSRIYKTKQFNFMSYPAIFDDYVKLFHHNSNIFFHDNGLALKYNVVKYTPEFVDIDIEHDFLIKLYDFLQINCFIIHKEYEYLVNNLLQFYPGTFTSENTDETVLKDFIFIYE